MPALSIGRKFTLTVASLAVLAGSGLLVWRGYSHFSAMPDQSVHANVQPTTGLSEHRPNATDVDVAVNENPKLERHEATQPQAPLSESEAFERVICSRDDMGCSRDALAANSPEEARWLNQHGYPTEEQIRASDALSTSALRDLAAGGSLAYGALLGRRLLEEEAYVPGMGKLIETARAGGIYSLHVISDTHANMSGPQPDMVGSLAYLRLAYLMGDRKAGDLLALRAEQFGAGPVELRMADEQAAHLRNQMFQNIFVPPRP